MTAPSRAPFPALRQLAISYGVQPSYTDMFGRRRVASAESLLTALAALGAPIHRRRDVRDALRERRRSSWANALEPVLVAWNGRAGKIPLRLEAKYAREPVQVRITSETGEEFRWDVRLEDLPVAQEISLEGKRYALKRFPIARKLALGYHRIQLQLRKSQFESLILSAPLRAYECSEKIWGVFLPLYALQSRSSWGAGDFSDLEVFQQWVSRRGGNAIATLPFLAAFLEKPAEISPYAPASRLFWNELYVDPRKAPEFHECPAARSLANSSQWQREAEALRDSPFVNYPRLLTLKRPVIKAMAQWLLQKKPHRYAAFEDYVRSHLRLTDYAEFRATLSRRQTPWPEWPKRLREGKLRVTDYSAEERHYCLYAQWLAEEQVRALGAGRSESGRGLYLDFPLGVHPHSYDVWRQREIFALGASAGAPPDTFFTKGQNWGSSPLHPDAIRRAGYAYLIACYQHQFRHANWFRIDHVMSLHRLFWIPQGLEPKDGVYVRYQPEEMYAILSLESHRSKTVVVGENLGTVPAVVNRAMRKHGLHQMYVLQYEARANRKRPLRVVPANAVASLNTHDMAPFAGFVAEADIEDLEQLGVFNDREASRQKRNREKVYEALAELFQLTNRKRSGPAVARLAQQCLDWLARSPAKMVLVNLEDLWLEAAPQNVPGTSHERPNWQRKARYSLEEFTRLRSVVRTLCALNRIRSSFAPKGRRK